MSSALEYLRGLVDGLGDRVPTPEQWRALCERVRAEPRTTAFPIGPTIPMYPTYPSPYIGDVIPSEWGGTGIIYNGTTLANATCCAPTPTFTVVESKP